MLCLEWANLFREEIPVGFRIMQEIDSLPSKKRKAPVQDCETGRFVKHNSLSNKFIAEHILFRTADFHESRPATQANSKNDYGWYPQMVKEWPLWLEDKRADIPKIPTRDILYKLWASH